MNSKNFYAATAVLLFTSIIAFSSCKKDKAEATENPPDGTAKAEIIYNKKTTNFSSLTDSSVAFLEWREAEKKFNFALILKDDATGMIIDMMIYPAKEGIGTYALGLTTDSWSLANVSLKGRSSSKAETFGYVWLHQDGELTASEGTVTISSMTDKNVKGSFSATLYSYNDVTKDKDKLIVKNGSFDVPLIRRDFDFANIP